MFGLHTFENMLLNRIISNINVKYFVVILILILFIMYLMRLLRSMFIVILEIKK